MGEVARTAEFAVRVFLVWPGQIRVRRSDGILIRSMMRAQRSICSAGLRPAALTPRYNNSTASLMAREKTRTAESAVRATGCANRGRGVCPVPSSFFVLHPAVEAHR